MSHLHLRASQARHSLVASGQQTSGSLSSRQRRSNGRPTRQRRQRSKAKPAKRGRKMKLLRQDQFPSRDLGRRVGSGTKLLPVTSGRTSPAHGRRASLQSLQARVTTAVRPRGSNSKDRTPNLQNLHLPGTVVPHNGRNRKDRLKSQCPRTVPSRSGNNSSSKPRQEKASSRQSPRLGSPQTPGVVARAAAARPSGQQHSRCRTNHKLQSPLGELHSPGRLLSCGNQRLMKRASVLLWGW
mmetsp:Transcript_3674/g.10572  ORF Transcript_3674/g.10572 Transcript_3674/m.10572 type:complete len:240 (-) Transcript_3674:1274-1993(-)